MPDIIVSFSQTAYDKLIVLNIDEPGIKTKLKGAGKDQVMSNELNVLETAHIQQRRDLNVVLDSESAAKKQEVDGWFA